MEERQMLQRIRRAVLLTTRAAHVPVAQFTRIVLKVTDAVVPPAQGDHRRVMHWLGAQRSPPKPSPVSRTPLYLAAASYVAAVGLDVLEREAVAQAGIAPEEWSAQKLLDPPPHGSPLTALLRPQLQELQRWALRRWNSAVADEQHERLSASSPASEYFTPSEHEHLHESPTPEVSSV